MAFSIGNRIAAAAQGLRGLFYGTSTPTVAPKDGKPDPQQMLRIVPLPFASVPLTEQKLLNDDSVYAVYNVYSDILLGQGWRFEGKDAEQVTALMDALPLAPGWSQLLDAMAAAPFQRLAAAEIVWDTADNWLPAKYRVLPLAATKFDLSETQDVQMLHVSTTAGLQALPIQNAIVHRYRPTFEHPLGVSVYDNLQEVIDYKRRADRAAIRILERMAGGSIIGWYSPNTDNAAQKALLTALQTLQSAAVGILPGPKGDAGNSIEILEAKSGAGMDFVISMLNMYERRIARAILGSVLAVFESEFGTRAQSETHLKILQAVVASYQKDIEEPINRQLVKPVLRYNVPNGDKLDVSWKLNAPDFSDQGKTAQWVEGLTQSGVIDPLNEADNAMIRKLFELDLRKVTAQDKANLPLLKSGQKPPMGAGQ